MPEAYQCGFQLLIEALSNENWQVRLNAAVALGEIGNPTATPALIAALNDGNWEVRANVTIALGKGVLYRYCQSRNEKVT